MVTLDHRLQHPDSHLDAPRRSPACRLELGRSVGPRALPDARATRRHTAARRLPQRRLEEPRRRVAPRLVPVRGDDDVAGRPPAAARVLGPGRDHVPAVLARRQEPCLDRHERRVAGPSPDRIGTVGRRPRLAFPGRGPAQSGGDPVLPGLDSGRSPPARRRKHANLALRPLDRRDRSAPANRERLLHRQAHSGR